MAGAPHKATRTEHTMIIALITGTFIFIPAGLAGLVPLAIAGAICMSLARVTCPPTAWSPAIS